MSRRTVAQQRIYRVEPGALAGARRVAGAVPAPLERPPRRARASPRHGRRSDEHDLRAQPVGRRRAPGRRRPLDARLRPRPAPRAGPRLGGADRVVAARGLGAVHRRPGSRPNRRRDADDDRRRRRRGPSGVGSSRRAADDARVHVGDRSPALDARARRRGHAADARAHSRRPRLGAEGRRRLAPLLDVAERLLDGDPVGPIRGEDAKNYGWDRLHDAYAETLGT